VKRRIEAGGTFDEMFDETFDVFVLNPSV